MLQHHSEPLESEIVEEAAPSNTDLMKAVTKLEIQFARMEERYAPLVKVFYGGMQLIVGAIVLALLALVIKKQ